MGSFTAQDSLRPRWDPRLKPRAVFRFGVAGVAFLAVAVVLWFGAGSLIRAGYALPLLGVVLAAIAGVTCIGAALAIQFVGVVGRLLFRLAFPIFLIGVAAIVLIAWAPALLYDLVDDVRTLSEHVSDTAHARTVADFEQYLGQWIGSPANGGAVAGLRTAAAYALWPLQFRLTRDVLAMVGVIGFISIVAMFGIWWERKVAGRMQSRLGPMRVGGWHGWSQSMADGIKLIQKEDLAPDAADHVLFRLAPYVVFVPAVSLFLVLPFSAAWVCRDLDVGLIFIFAMIGIGVLGVLMAGWASNNKWSMFGAMREACQMISYEIPLGFSLLVPVMTAGTLRLTTIGQMQAGGFHTWLAFSNPFAFAAALIFFTATLASCKRAPFDLPEAESELVAGYHTEYSGYRWSMFFFAEYAEMFAVGALAVILFFGAWNSPLPAAWGAAWADGPLWQRALHGIVFSGPLWFVFKGFFMLYVQIWLRWTLPRIRIDQVMHACVQAILPLAMVALLGNALWELLVPGGSWPAVLANVVLTAVGVAFVLGFITIMVYGFANRRRLVGTLVIDHLPGA